MAMAVSGGGVDGLISRSGEAAWAGDLAPVADGASEEGLPFRIFGGRRRRKRSRRHSAQSSNRSEAWSSSNGVQQGTRGSEGQCQNVRL